MATTEKPEPEESEPAKTGQRAQRKVTPDVGQFDGSADPNPGGRMGMGWHFTLVNGVQYLGAAEEPPAPDNTNNRAEYLALISLLDEYQGAGGQGPLLVRGDSQLVIMQMTGQWSVRNPGLLGLYERAQRAMKAVPGGVRFEWVPRALNAQADRLASGKLGVVNPADAAQPRTLTYAQAPVSGVPAPLAAQIAKLNAKESVSFKELLGLRVGGRDKCSDMGAQQLRAAAGPDCVTASEEAFPGDERSQATALRWALRGLAVEHAIKKVADRCADRSDPSRKRRQAGGSAKQRKGSKGHMSVDPKPDRDLADNSWTDADLPPMPQPPARVFVRAGMPAARPRNR